jgi:two-component system, NarL family, invasion response regulator UvrY
MQKKIIIADDHSIIRNGLKLYLQYNLGMGEVTEVGSCNELMKELVKNKYTHLILDIILSDGSSIEVLPNIRKVYPQLNIMIFSMQPEEVYGNALT